MTTRPNSPISVTTTDVLIAMLSSDLRGSWAEPGCALRSREHADPSASSPLPVVDEEPEPEEPSR